MDKQLFIESANRIFTSLELNNIPKEKALSEELVSVQIFEEPIIAVAGAGDIEFETLQKEGVIGSHFMLPTQWLPTAKTVVSFFFPFTERIRSSNRQDADYPSNGWMNGRIEGQTFINDFSARIVDFLNGSGFQTVVPSIDARFIVNNDTDRHNINQLFTSNWSERHVAYVCGAGTLSLSKSLITEKGAAGRLTSVITELMLPPDEKKFQDYNENCILCGKCIENCPVQAISFEHGKNHKLCSDFLDSILAEHAPWYGCGKCQTNVPCECENPKAVG